MKSIATKMAAVLLLAGCHQTTTNANEGPYGGGDAQPTFRSAQKSAVQKLKNLRTCAFPLEADKEVVTWISQNANELALDIQNSPHSWVRDSNVPCARTTHSKGSKIVFSYSNCEKITPQDAFMVLVHESVHHFGFEDEVFPTEVAQVLHQTSDGNCIPQMNEVLSLEKNISSWPDTAAIKALEIKSEGICFDYSSQQVWPEIDPFNAWKTIGNYWIVAYIDGRWLASTYEWILPSLRCEEDNAASIGAGTKQPAFATWIPKKGELVGFMISSVVRFGESNGVKERSPIYWMRWP